MNDYQFELPQMVDETPGNDGLPRLTADLVAAYVSNNPVGLADLTRLIHETHIALTDISRGPMVVEAPEELKPAVPVGKSVTPDYIICLENGRKFRSLKRHLATLGMTPEQYRAKWDLPIDYPMVAPNYSAARSDLAKKIGLGRKPAARAALAPKAQATQKAPPASGKAKASPAKPWRKRVRRWA